MHDLRQFTLPRNFRGRGKIYVQLWWIADNLLFRLSPQICYGWRRWLLRAFGAKIGAGVRIRPTATVTYPWKLEVGDYAWIGDEVVLYNLERIQIGAHSVVSQRSYLCTGSHRINSRSFEIFATPIVVEDHVWIATDTFIAPGVTVREGSVIGARSSVFKDVPPMVIARGTPSEVVGVRLVDRD